MTLRALIAATAVSCAVAPAALAAPANAPVPCTGLDSYVDPAGDQRIGAAGRSTPVTDDATMDIKEFFWTTKGSTVYANLRLATMTDDSAAAPLGSAGLIYRLLYSTAEGQSRYIDISFSQVFGTSYNTGYFDPGPTGDGSVSGKVWRGADGVIQVSVAGARVGQPLTDAYFFSARDEVAILAQSDRAPNAPELAEYSGAACQV